MTPNKIGRGFFWSLGVLAIVALAGLVGWQIQRVGSGHGVAAEALTKLGGPWTLTDQAGQPRTDRSFPGKLQVMFFGYRYCPDICPTELQAIAETLDLLGADASQVQPLFISINPQRDTPAALAEYTALFDSRILGLTGTPDQVAAMATAFRVYYARIEAKDGGADDYLMDHSAFVYLTDRTGAVAGVVPPGTKPADLAGIIRTRLKS